MNLTRGDGIRSDFLTSVSPFVHENILIRNLTVVGEGSPRRGIYLGSVGYAGIDDVSIDVDNGFSINPVSCSYCRYVNVTNSSVVFNGRLGWNWFNSLDIIMASVNITYDSVEEDGFALRLRGGSGSTLPYNITNLRINLTHPVGNLQRAIWFDLAATEDSEIRDSIITSAGTNATDLWFTGPASSDTPRYFINTTFNKSRVEFETATQHSIRVGWYVDLYVNDSLGDPLVASINYTDSGTASSINPTSSATGITTGADGYSRDNIIYEYSENITSRYYHTNYSFDLSSTGYALLRTNPRNFTDNAQLTFTFGLDTCSPPGSGDWIVEISDNCSVSLSGRHPSERPAPPRFRRHLHDRSDRIVDRRRYLLRAGCVRQLVHVHRPDRRNPQRQAVASSSCSSSSRSARLRRSPARSTTRHRRTRRSSCASRTRRTPTENSLRTARSTRTASTARTTRSRSPRTARAA
jgi:hypothetical protein